MFGIMSGRKIAVCGCGTKQKPEPLVPTFAFRGAEYWCAKCGTTYGMFDVNRAEYTDELGAEQKRREEMTEEYLHAVAVPMCSSILFDGEWCEPQDLPQHEKDRLKAIRDKGWKWPEDSDNWEDQEGDVQPSDKK